MMKKLIVVFLAICIIIVSFTIIPACVNTSKSVKSVSLTQNTISKTTIASQKTNKPQYTYDSKTRTLTISIKGEMNETPWEHIKHPEHIVLKKGVTSICDYGFGFVREGNTGKRQNYNDRIKTIRISDTVKTIGNDAFSYCKKLNKINLPKIIKSIGEKAFSNCKSLKSIKLPYSLKTIHYGTFEDCINLKTVKFNKKLKEIGESAFFNCEKLTEVNLPSSLTTIEDSAFLNCYSLEKVTMRGDLRTINDSSFMRCKKLSKVKLSRKIQEIKSWAFMSCSKLKMITIPKSVQKIEDEALGYKDEKVKIKGFTIKGYKGTAAEDYAKKNKFKFVALD